jgi:cation transport ATPase
LSPKFVFLESGVRLAGNQKRKAPALEDATKLDVVIFDKIRTLTVGQPEVIDVVTAEN